jgi:phosphoglycerate kinase
LRYEFLTLDDVEIEGKTVFVRVDVNSPIDPESGVIMDDTRIRAVVETLKDLRRCRTVIGSHQSRPGKGDFTSLEQHAMLLRRYTLAPVRFIDDVIGPAARQAIRNLKVGEILVLDNLRLCSEENIEDKPEELRKTLFIKRLAPLFDLYVNDAFAALHRCQPSMLGFTDLMPSVVGRIMERELKAINTVIDNPARPCVFVLGGAKVEDRLPIIESLLKKGVADKILLGGLLGKAMLKAKGINLGPGSEADLKPAENSMKLAEKLIQEHGSSIESPIDLAADKDGSRTEVDVAKLPLAERTLDIGRDTIKRYSKIISEAGTVVAEGPMGMFEKSGFEIGTQGILQAIANAKGYTVLGGGHLAAIAQLNEMSHRFKHISTGGGALLTLFTGERLPVIEALERAAKRLRGEQTR